MAQRTLDLLQTHASISCRVIRLFMGWKTAAVGAGFGVQLGHVVNVLLGEAAGIIDFGKFFRNLGKTMVLQSADVVASLCGLAFGMGTGMTFHGGIYGLN